MTKTKKKLRTLQFWSWVCLLTPIIGVIGFNAKDYFTMEQGFVFPQGVELGLGIGLSVACGVMLALGKTGLFKGSKGFGITLVICILVNAIIGDLILILTALFAGSFAFERFTGPIARTKQTLAFEEQGNIQAKALSNVMQEVAKQQATVTPIGRA